MRRISWKVWLTIAITFWLFLILIVFWLNCPYPANPVSLKWVAWKEIGKIEGCADFDGDGNDELVIRDKQRQLWAVWWGEEKRRRKKLPVPKSARLISLQQPIFLFHDVKQDLREVRFTEGQWQVKNVPIDDWFRSLGWQRCEKGVYVAFADVDGDKRIDRIEWDFKKDKLRVTTAEGMKWVHQANGRWAIKDLNCDEKAELIGENLVGGGNWLIVCRDFDTKEKKWKSDSVRLPFKWRKGNSVCEFCLESAFAVKYGKNFVLIGFTHQRQKTQIWKLVWQGDRWQKELFDKFEGEGEPVFTGQDWLALTELKSPQ